MRRVHGKKHLLSHDKNLITRLQPWDPSEVGSRESWLHQVVLFYVHTVACTPKHIHNNDNNGDDAADFVKIFQQKQFKGKRGYFGLSFQRGPSWKGAERQLVTQHLHSGAERWILTLSSLSPSHSVWNSSPQNGTTFCEWAFLPQLTSSTKTLIGITRG